MSHFCLEQGQVLKASTGTPPPKLYTVRAPPGVFLLHFCRGFFVFLRFSSQSTKKVLANKNY